MINREHKDRLFNFIFGSSENKSFILSLYNAINNSSYTDEEAVEINTLDDAVYMSMNNDTSFLLYWTMNIWEHQSTYNPNMPIRELMYISKLYDKYIHRKKLNIFSSSVIPLPIPKLMVFYNGKKDEPDEKILRLSDAFYAAGDGIESDIELNVRMLNINYGHNKRLMESCRPLYEYAWFIDRIRRYEKEMDLEEAVDLAIDKMPDDFLLKEFLVVHRGGVKMSCLTEYNEEETLRMIGEEHYQLGIQQGIQRERERTQQERKRAEQERKRAEQEIADLHAQIEALQEALNKKS